MNIYINFYFYYINYIIIYSLTFALIPLNIENVYMYSYVLNKRWLDTSRKTPTYEEIVGDEDNNNNSNTGNNNNSSSSSTTTVNLPNAVVSEEIDEQEDEILEKTDLFEAKYNFRHEEP